MASITNDVRLYMVDHQVRDGQSTVSMVRAARLVTDFTSDHIGTRASHKHAPIEDMFLDIRINPRMQKHAHQRKEELCPRLNN